MAVVVVGEVVGFKVAIEEDIGSTSSGALSCLPGPRKSWGDTGDCCSALVPLSSLTSSKPALAAVPSASPEVPFEIGAASLSVESVTSLEIPGGLGEMASWSWGDMQQGLRCTGATSSDGASAAQYSPDCALGAERNVGRQ